MTTTSDQNARRAVSGPPAPGTHGTGLARPDGVPPAGGPHQRKTDRRPRQRHHLHAGMAVAIALAIVGCAALGLFVINEMEGDISVKAFEDVILSWGHWGVLASMGLMVLHSFVPFPAELVALANGMLYGPVWGTLVTWVGAMLGAFLAFGLSRFLGRPFVETMVARRDWQRLDEWTGTHAPQMVFFARFVPVISFNLVNYAAGLTRISWWTFGWTTGLGILPMTTIMAVMGAQATTLPWYWWLVLLAAAGIGWLALRWWLHGRTTKTDSAAAVPTESPEPSEEADSGRAPECHEPMPHSPTGRSH